MISEKALLIEYKRLPKLIKENIKQGNLMEAQNVKITMETIEWILSENE